MTNRKSRKEIIKCRLGACARATCRLRSSRRACGSSSVPREFDFDQLRRFHNKPFSFSSIRRGNSEDLHLPTMAGLVRLRNVQKLMSRLSLTPVTKRNTALNLCRALGTSNIQKSDNTVGSCTPPNPKPKKSWVSYGFSNEDEWLDNHFMHVTFFVCISFCLTFGGYLLIYLPDFRQHNWTSREAYLELRRRESLGLPPIDPNLIDPAKVHLPTDEELGDTEIII